MVSVVQEVYGWLQASHWIYDFDPLKTANSLCLLWIKLHVLIAEVLLIYDVVLANILYIYLHSLDD